MRWNLHQIGTLCIALFLGGSMSLCLFLFMIFLIEPAGTTNGRIRRPYVVSFVDLDHENKTKTTKSKRLAKPKPSRSPALTPITAKAISKIARKRQLVRLPRIGPIHITNAGREQISVSNIGEQENYDSKYSRKVQFNRVETKYLHPHEGKTLPPERLRIIGGGEIDRIGNTCFEIPSVGVSENSDTGQTAVEKDLNQSHSMNSMTAHQVSCGKSNSSLAQDFLNHLKKRGLIMAPASKTH